MILVKLIDNECSSPSSIPEWAAIEVQGELESRHHTPFERQYVGDLFATIKDNVPILIIGHHILYGKMQTFDKPLAVMKKTEEAEASSYIVQAIITKKLLFKNRPKPIIANVNKIV
ncbi:Chromosome transmission fidelity protein 8 [Cinara cedri]|uniref:Chromosome transmission fidelity protein 8 n=1 Tax=Cinara cedri TaxID=506608 RepID=A0A5E4MZG4_9HEMI|nr:Chromosome transmission fidelity protein 8 [Cinara cedri]